MQRNTCPHGSKERWSLWEPCAVEAASTVLRGESLQEPTYPTTYNVLCTKGSNPFASIQR